MDPDFWKSRWETNHLGWHLDNANPALVKHITLTGTTEGARVFVPLCGKTRDIGWLRSQGYRVVGIELSDIAIQQLFQDLDLTPEVRILGALKRYSVPDLDIFVGDIFALTQDQLGPVHLIYDRAAMIALPQNMRRRYVTHVAKITGQAQQFVISLDYDQSALKGPPFSVPDTEIKDLYAADYSETLLSNKAIPGGLKGKCPAQEQAWLLQPRIAQA